MLLSISATLYATYVPLVSDFPVKAAGTGSLGDYINTIIIFAIGLAGVLAVVMIIVGGVQYVSSDSWYNKDDGKKRIQAAVGGLILALCSYLILNTIDPNLTNLSFDIETVKGLQNKGGSLSIYDSSTVGGINYSTDLSATLPSSPTFYNNGSVEIVKGEIQPISNTLQRTPWGYVITPTKVALDTDGRGVPPFYDATRQGATSYQPGGQSLDANIDFFVVVPVDDKTIKTGSKVLVTNNTTGRQIWAVVGDRGPGYGEISLAAAKALGAWTEGMGDSIRQHNITYQFYEDK